MRGIDAIVITTEIILLLHYNSQTNENLFCLKNTAWIVLLFNKKFVYICVLNELFKCFNACAQNVFDYIGNAN